MEEEIFDRKSSRNGKMEAENRSKKPGFSAMGTWLSYTKAVSSKL
jgi:hypothetical protein